MVHLTTGPRKGVILEIEIDSMFKVPIIRTVRACIGGIAEGDLALVRRMPDVESGTLAVVVNGDEGVIKRVIKKPGIIELHSFNPYYPVRIIKGEELEIVRIVGKVLETKRT